VVFLVSQDAPSRAVLAAGGGAFAVYQGFETVGTSLLPDRLSAEGVAAAWQVIAGQKDMQVFASGFDQASKFATMNAATLGIQL
jgi:hypothetical protein